MSHARSGETLGPLRHQNLPEFKQGKICESKFFLKEMWKMCSMNVEPRLQLAKGHLYPCPCLCVGMVKGPLCLSSWLWVWCEQEWRAGVPSVPMQYSTELPCRITNVLVKYTWHSYGSSTIQIQSLATLNKWQPHLHLCRFPKNAHAMHTLLATEDLG